MLLAEIMDHYDGGRSTGHPRDAQLCHLGRVDCTVGELFTALRERPRRAVRSGHVGNWGEIWQGRSGLLDYNRYICRDLALGVPMLHAHTLTETEDFSEGDTLYLPAGRLTYRRYQRMELFVRSGDSFTAVPGGESVCSAVAFTEVDRMMRPLVQVRSAELRDIPGATTIPTFLLENEDLLRRALSRLLDDALRSNGGLRLAQIFGSSVSRRGRRGRAPVAEAGGFEVNGTPAPSRSALVSAAVEALRFGSLKSSEAHDQEQAVGEYLPLLGSVALLALLAYQDCHRAGNDAIHAHWGAVSMSGYPPLSGGYLTRRATRRVLRALGVSLSGLPEFDVTLRFALLPAPILSLLPPREFESDGELVNDLMISVLRKTERPGSDPSVALGQINDLVAFWMKSNRHRLSPYYLSRFTSSSMISPNMMDVPVDGAPLPADVLSDLTMQQASMLFGALRENAERLALKS